MYPKAITFDHLDGEGAGEAYKPKQGEPWTIMLAGGQFRFYGSATQVRKRIRLEDPTVKFTGSTNV